MAVSSTRRRARSPLDVRAWEIHTLTTCAARCSRKCRVLRRVIRWTASAWSRVASAVRVRSSGLKTSSGEIPQVSEDAACAHLTTRPVETGSTVLPAPGVVPAPGALESFEERTDGHQL